MGSLSPMLYPGLVVLMIGVSLQIAGLATPKWAENALTDFKFGIWKACNEFKCVDLKKDPFFWDEYSSELEAVRAMMILGMICGLVGCFLAVVMIVFITHPRTVNIMMPIVCGASSIAGFIFIIIGVIIFGVGIYNDNTKLKENYDLGYSFALCIVGGILLPIGGGLAYVGGKASA